MILLLLISPELLEFDFINSNSSSVKFKITFLIPEPFFIFSKFIKNYIQQWFVSSGSLDIPKPPL